MEQAVQRRVGERGMSRGTEGERVDGASVRDERRSAWRGKGRKGSREHGVCGESVERGGGEWEEESVCGAERLEGPERSDQSEFLPLGGAEGGGRGDGCSAGRRPSGGRECGRRAQD